MVWVITLTKLALIILALLFILSVASPSLLPTSFAQSQAFERLLEVAKGDLVLTYEVVRTVYISNLSGRLVTYSVGQEYMVRARALDKSHVIVEGYRFPGSMIEVSASSSDWVGIGGFMYWTARNYTDFLIKHVLTDYNQTVDRGLAVDLINSLTVVPLIHEKTTQSCFSVSIASAYVNGFEVSIITEGGSGAAYYDCKYGILIKGNVTRLTQQAVSDATYVVRDTVCLELHRANTEILNDIVFKEQLTDTYSVWVLIISVTAVLIASMLILYHLILARRRISGTTD